MTILIEMIDNWEIEELLYEMDDSIATYNSMCDYTELHEGMAGDLHGNTIAQANELFKNYKTVIKARATVKQMLDSDSNGAKQEKVHLLQARQAMLDTLKGFRTNVKDFFGLMKKGVMNSGSNKFSNKSDALPNANDNTYDAGIQDVGMFGKFGPFLFKKAAANDLAPLANNPKYADVIVGMQEQGMIDDNYQLTNNGKASYKAHNDKKGRIVPDSKKAIDDLANMGSDGDTQKDLDDFG